MNLIIDLAVVALTVSALFLSPLVYWLLVGRLNSPTARDRRERAKQQRRAAREVSK